MTAYEMAQKYYPALWDEDRLNQLVTAGVLTQDDVDAIVNGDTLI